MSLAISASEALNTEKQIALSPALVQEMLNGTFTNNDFLIKTEAELNTRQLTNSTGTVTLAKSYDPVVYPEPVEGAQ